jgi:excisionase family DNA binding protein
MPVTLKQEKRENVRSGFATVAEAARYLAVGRVTIYAMMNRGQLKSVVLPGTTCRRIPWTALEALAQ